MLRTLFLKFVSQPLSRKLQVLPKDYVKFDDMAWQVHRNLWHTAAAMLFFGLVVGTLVAQVSRATPQNTTLNPLDCCFAGYLLLMCLGGWFPDHG